MERDFEVKKSIAVIGQGFVGGSLTTVMFERGFDVYVYDKAGISAVGGKMHEHEVTSIRQFVQMNEEYGATTREMGPIAGFTGVYFVCVPTPMYEDGGCDTSIVESVLTELSVYPGKRIAVVKSTVPPGSTEAWNKKFEGTGLRVVFCPEFLTETNALDDMRNQTRIVLGGPRPHINAVKQVFQTAFPKVPIVKTSSTTAEMVKYFTNVQLATRVVLSCELAQVCEALDAKGMNIDYDKVVEYAKLDPRLGNSHMNMPEIRGARGHCFPKDIGALEHLAKSVGVKSTVISAVIEKNLEVVPEEHRDWEKMLGRAVSKRK